MADRFCKSCGVKVSEDLANCPLCGKYLLKENEKVALTKFSYPKYNFSAVQREKAVKILKNITFYAIIICVLVNLIFATRPFWFPLAIVPLFCLYMIFVHPFKHGGNLLKNLPVGAAYASFMLIFLDAYLKLNYGAKFGWATAVVVPIMWIVVILTCFIVGLSSKNFARSIVRIMPIILILSLVYLIVINVAFKGLLRWPSLVFVCAAAGWFVFSFSFKRKLFATEMKKDYHVN